MFGSFLPSLWLVRTTKAYSGMGADIVMESFTLIDGNEDFVDSAAPSAHQRGEFSPVQFCSYIS